MKPMMLSKIYTTFKLKPKDKQDIEVKDDVPRQSQLSPQDILRYEFLPDSDEELLSQHSADDSDQDIVLKSPPPKAHKRSSLLPSTLHMLDSSDLVPPNSRVNDVNMQLMLLQKQLLEKREDIQQRRANFIKANRNTFDAIKPE